MLIEWNGFEGNVDSTVGLTLLLKGHVMACVWVGFSMWMYSLKATQRTILMFLSKRRMV